MNKDNDIIFLNLINNIKFHCDLAIKKKLPNLIIDEKEFLKKLLINIVFLIINTSFQINKTIILNALINDNHRDIINLLLQLLPYIDSKQDTSEILSIKDLGLKKINPKDNDFINTEPKYKFSNIQYNRFFRKQEKEYIIKKRDILHNYYLLCETIKEVTNSLYVNWIYIEPLDIGITGDISSIYETYNRQISCFHNKDDPFFININDENLENYLKKKWWGNNFIFQREDYFEFNPLKHKKLSEIKLYSKKITLNTIYNTIVNELYKNCESFEWLIKTNNYIKKSLNDTPTILLINEYIPLITIIKNKKWNQINDLQREEFKKKIDILRNIFLKNDNITYQKVYDEKISFFLKNLFQIIIFSFTKYYFKINKYKNLINLGLFNNEIEYIKSNSIIRDFFVIDYEDLYEFLFMEFYKFKKSYYGGILLSNVDLNDNEEEILEKIYLENYKEYLFRNLNSPILDIKNNKKNILAPYDIYLQSKLLLFKDEIKSNSNHYQYDGDLYSLNWCQLSLQEKKELRGILLSNVNSDFLNIKNVFSDKDLYTFNCENCFEFKEVFNDSFDLNFIYNGIDDRFNRFYFPIIIQECLSFLGRLSFINFDNKYLEIDENKKGLNVEKKYKQIKLYLENKYNSNSRSQKYNTYSFFNNCNYFLTNKKYKKLKYCKDNDGKNNSYLNYLLNPGVNWYNFYAMNWTSQICFFHKFLNNRVMFVTGGTGVGKSSQIPKLLLYATRILQYKPLGKIICTQPRIPPTENNAKRISNEMGLSINLFNSLMKKNIPTDNFNIQYKHSKSNHSSDLPELFLKITTDGSLYEEIIRNPILKKRTKSNNKKGKFQLIKENKEHLVTEDYQYLIKYGTENIYDCLIIDESHEHNVNMDLILSLLRNTLYYNNDLKLVIISATMDNDEPIFRRFYRDINDNRMYPFNRFLNDSNENIDRINVDRRLHIANPISKIDTNYPIKDIYFDYDVKNKNENDIIIKLLKEKIFTNMRGDVLIFKPTISEINKLVKLINNDKDISNSILALPFHGKLDNEKRNLVENIHKRRNELSFNKSEDFSSVRINKNLKGKYKYIIIVATNVAEASITIPSLFYVIDNGLANIVNYNCQTKETEPIIVEIDENSRKQRRGRVGRTQPGIVYYLYKKNSKLNNKSYNGIFTSNIYENLYNLFSNSGLEKVLIDTNSNPNNINNFNYLNLINDTNKNTYYKFNLNDFIKKQYYLEDKVINYFGNNKLYDYSNSTTPINYLQTGYHKDAVVDKYCNFYIIHPNELDLQRNIFGEIVKIKKNSLNKNCEIIINIDDFGKNYIKSDKIKSMLEQIQTMMLMIFAKNDNRFYKTNIGINIFKIKRLTQIININKIISYTYSLGYGCSKYLRLLLSIHGEQEPFNNLLSFFDIKKIDKSKNMYGSPYGDIHALLSLGIDVIKLLKLDDIFTINIFEKEKVKNLRILNNLKQKFFVYKNYHKLKFRDYFFLEKSSFSNLNENIVDRFIEFNKLYINGKLFNSKEINEYELNELLKEDILELFLNLVMKNENIKTKIENWCSNKNVKKESILKFISNYIYFFNKLFKLENKFMEIDYDDDDNNIDIDWIKTNIKKIININTNNNHELVIKSLLHGHFLNIAKIIPGYSRYVRIINPNPLSIYEIFNSKKNEISLLKQKFNINYLLYLSSNNNSKQLITIARINNSNWIKECLPLLLLEDNFKKNIYLKKNLKLEIRNMLLNRKKNKKYLKNLEPNILSKYADTVFNILDDLTKKDNLTLEKIKSYFSEQENNYGNKLLNDILL